MVAWSSSFVDRCAPCFLLLRAGGREPCLLSLYPSWRLCRGDPHSHLYRLCPSLPLPPHPTGSPACGVSFGSGGGDDVRGGRRAHAGVIAGVGIRQAFDPEAWVYRMRHSIRRSSNLLREIISRCFCNSTLPHRADGESRKIVSVCRCIGIDRECGR